MRSDECCTTHPGSCFGPVELKGDWKPPGGAERWAGIRAYSLETREALEGHRQSVQVEAGEKRKGVGCRLDGRSV